jgi:hypothetical protein
MLRTPWAHPGSQVAQRSPREFDATTLQARVYAHGSIQCLRPNNPKTSEAVDMATPSLDGWNITRYADTDWAPWGNGGAQAKVLGSADGYLVALVEADAGYQGTPHEHGYAAAAKTNGSSATGPCRPRTSDRARLVHDPRWAVTLVAYGAPHGGGSWRPLGVAAHRGRRLVHGGARRTHVARQTTRRAVARVEATGDGAPAKF